MQCFGNSRLSMLINFPYFDIFMLIYNSNTYCYLNQLEVGECRKEQPFMIDTHDRREDDPMETDAQGK